MIIKYINEGAFTKYNDPKQDKEARMSQLKKNTADTIRKHILKEEICPVVQEKIETKIIQECSHMFEKSIHLLLNFGPKVMEVIYDRQDIPDDIGKLIDIDVEVRGKTIYFNIPCKLSMAMLVFSPAEFFYHNFKEILERMLVKDEEVQDMLKKNGFDNIEIYLYLEKDGQEVHTWDVTQTTLCYSGGKLKDYDRLFSQFRHPIMIETKVLNFYCSTGYEEDYSDVGEFGKYFKVIDNLKIESCCDNVKSLEGLRPIISDKCKELDCSIKVSTKQAMVGPTPEVKKISDEFLKTYFNKTYEEVINENPVQEFGRKKPWISKLGNIRFVTNKRLSKPFTGVEFWCTTY